MGPAAATLAVGCVSSHSLPPLKLPESNLIITLCYCTLLKRGELCAPP